MMFHGVEMMQKIEMKTVALKMLMYFGALKRGSMNQYKVPWSLSRVSYHPSDIVRERISASSNLIANGRKDKGCRHKELRSTGVKLGNDRGHVPLKLTPNIGVSVGNEDRCKSTQRANDWKSKELMRAREPILGKSTEIWHVDSQ